MNSTYWPSKLALSSIIPALDSSDWSGFGSRDGPVKWPSYKPEDATQQQKPQGKRSAQKRHRHGARRALQ